jgi:hypothetical protein
LLVKIALKPNRVFDNLHFYDLNIIKDHLNADFREEITVEPFMIKDFFETAYDLEDDNPNALELHEKILINLLQNLGSDYMEKKFDSISQVILNSY